MRFEAEQRFPAPPAAVLAAYADPALYEGAAGPRVDRPELLGVDRDGDVVTVRVRYRFTADVPSAARAVIDPDRLTWVEESRYDLSGFTSATRLLPDHYPDRLTASASSRFEPDPDDPSATRRRITGEVSVRAPLVAGRVERAIIDGVREHLAAEADRVADHLRR